MIFMKEIALSVGKIVTTEGWEPFLTNVATKPKSAFFATTIVPAATPASDSTAIKTVPKIGEIKVSTAEMLSMEEVQDTHGILETSLTIEECLADVKMTMGKATVKKKVLSFTLNVKVDILHMGVASVDPLPPTVLVWGSIEALTSHVPRKSSLELLPLCTVPMAKKITPAYVIKNARINIMELDLPVGQKYLKDGLTVELQLLLHPINAEISLLDKLKP